MGRLPPFALLAFLSACSSSETNPYFPLESGRSWQYRLTLEVIKDTPPKRVLVHNLGRSEVDGRVVYLQRTQMEPLAVYTAGEQGIRRLDTFERDGSDTAASTPVLPRPLRVGSTWKVESRLRLIESRTFAREDKLHSRSLPLPLEYRIVDLDARIDTPAGQFRDCLLVQAEGQRTVKVDRGNNVALVKVKHSDWYAPDVGLVRSERIETSDSTFLEPGRYLLELLYYDD